MTMNRFSLVSGCMIIGASLLFPLGAAESASGPAAATVAPQQMHRGSEVYHQICFACHQLNGHGLPGAFPPLAGSRILLHQQSRVISILLHGLQGPVKVRGNTYNGVMPTLDLSDQQIADVMTYALNSWGNHGGAVTEKQVADERRSLAHHPGKAPATHAQGGMMAAGGMMGGHGMMANR